MFLLEFATHIFKKEELIAMFEKYENKKVVIETYARKVFRGTVGDIVYPEDNNNGIESIILDAIGFSNPVEFYPNEIKSIHLL